MVGLSGDPSRTACSIARLLQGRGKRIVPIHPDAPVVLGSRATPTLADVPFPIDVVDVFRRSESAGEFADQAVAIGAEAVWFQPASSTRPPSSGLGRRRPDGHGTCPAIEWRRRPLDAAARLRCVTSGARRAPDSRTG